MRLIGIQALLLLMKRREEAIAESFSTSDATFDPNNIPYPGYGGSVGTRGISNAGVQALASGHGIATGRSGISDVIAIAAGIGTANGVALPVGVYSGIAVAVGFGSCAAQGFSIGIAAGVASASGVGAASAADQTLNVTAATASASGVGSSAVVGQIFAVSAPGSAAGVGIATAVGVSVHFVRVTQDYIEIVNSGDPSTQLARATQSYIEVINSGDPSAQVARATQSYIEVVMTPNYVGGAGSASGSGAANGAS